MQHIFIKNLGPLKLVDIDLTKLNVIIGPQSSGKSTIAKVISYCQWVEKRYILDGKFDYKFSEQFTNFHRISPAYFNHKSLFRYESDFIIIEYDGNTELIQKKVSDIIFKKSKNIYIPAERNFVSVIPNLGKFKETNDNIMSFLYDWYETKNNYSENNTLKILNFPIRFHHNSQNDSDILSLVDLEKEIKLQNASSGLQSIIPLILIVDYLTLNFYEENHSNSVLEENQLSKTILENFKNKLKRNADNKNKSELATEIIENLNPAELKNVIDLVLSRTKYHNTKFIIEEPEQNLFPSTQRELIYFLLNKLTRTGRNHQLLLTTHSPYVLYALNNCIMGGFLNEKIPALDKMKMESKSSWIDPKEVSIWEIENGKLKSIKDQKTGTLSKHYFNDVMNNVMGEYYEMLNFYE